MLTAVSPNDPRRTRTASIKRTPIPNWLICKPCGILLSLCLSVEQKLIMKLTGNKRRKSSIEERPRTQKHRRCPEVVFRCVRSRNLQSWAVLQAQRIVATSTHTNKREKERLNCERVCLCDFNFKRHIRNSSNSWTTCAPFLMACLQFIFLKRDTSDQIGVMAMKMVPIGLVLFYGVKWFKIICRCSMDVYFF